MSKNGGVRLTFLGVYFPEWLVLMLCGICWYLYQRYQLAFRAPLELYLERVKGTVPCYLVSLLVVLLVLRILHIRQARKIRRTESPDFQVTFSQTFQAFRESFLTPRLIIRDLRFLHLICVMFVVFVNMKHLIPFVHPGHFDAELTSIEGRVFGADGAGGALIQYLGMRWAPVLASIYAFFYPFVAILIYLFVIQRNETLTVEFLTAFILLWFLGLGIVYAAPTRGPFYSSPKIYEKLPYTEVTSMQQKLLKHDAALKENPKHPNAVFLISAVPSLHLAVAVLGAWYFRRVNLLLSLFGWGFAALTTITTIYFGWHFVVCDLMAVLLALSVCRFSARLYSRRVRYYPVSYIPV